MTENVGVTFDSPEVDPSEYDTVEQLATLAAQVFAALGWTWAGGMPGAATLAERIAYHYGRHAEEWLEYTDSGRLMLLDQNPHDGSPVLFDGIQVLLRLGELPPVRGDQRAEADGGERIDLVALFRDRDCYDKSSGTYAIPIEAFEALAEVVFAAQPIMAQLELADDPVWDNNDDYDRLAAALARIGPTASPSPGRSDPA